MRDYAKRLRSFVEFEMPWVMLYAQKIEIEGECSTFYFENGSLEIQFNRGAKRIIAEFCFWPATFTARDFCDEDYVHKAMKEDFPIRTSLPCAFFELGGRGRYLHEALIEINTKNDFAIAVRALSEGMSIVLPQIVQGERLRGIVYAHPMHSHPWFSGLSEDAGW